jgi:hypothetical protein
VLSAGGDAESGFKMSRWIYFTGMVVLGLLLIACGLIIPAHIRAVDATVLRAAGSRTPSLTELAAQFLKETQPGPANLLLQVAKQEGLTDRNQATEASAELASRQPLLRFWGGPEPRLQAFADLPKPSAPNEPFTDFVVRTENRTRALSILQGSPAPGVKELLRCRNLTNTVLFPPSRTSSGQAFDTAIAVSSLLLVEDRLNPAFSNQLVTLAFRVNRGENPHRLEQALLDIMSLGQRLNWGQLAVLMQRVGDLETVRHFAGLLRKTEADLPSLYSAALVCGDAGLVTRYAMQFGDTGTRDLRAAMHYGVGGVRELLVRDQRLVHSRAENLLANAPFSYAPLLVLNAPVGAIIVKWLLYLVGGYLLAGAAHQYLLIRSRRFEMFSATDPLGSGRRSHARGQDLDLPPVRGMHVARQTLFALGFLLVVLLLSEPFLASESQKVDFPFRLRLPSVGAAAPVGPLAANASIMNHLSLLAMLLFFVLQALIYIACLFKLAEIRRQKIGPRMKLKLLENEDHLFDAGLYLGFVGTIISLILVSMGVIKPSLMAAYSSTSFGIIFVSIFKIFHLRPVRRHLLLEAEANPEPAIARSATPTP